MTPTRTPRHRLATAIRALAARIAPGVPSEATLVPHGGVEFWAESGELHIAPAGWRDRAFAVPMYSGRTMYLPARRKDPIEELFVGLNADASRRSAMRRHPAGTDRP